MISTKTYIYGKHAVGEAVKNKPKAINEILLDTQMDDVNLRNLIKSSGIRTSGYMGKRIKGIDDDANHQGVIAEVLLDQLVISYQQFIENLKVGPDTALVMFNEVQDPHNVGAVIRSATAFGIAGILIPEHNQAPVTGAVVKVSAGMAFNIPLVQIGNENNTIRDLKKRGFWIYGLAGEGNNSLTTEKFDAPAVFVLGNESTGLREKTREACDVLLSIPMNPSCESLNASASMSVTLYAWSSQHPDVLK